MLKIDVGKQKRIAIVAHDHRKDELMHFIETHLDFFKDHKLCGTGTTSNLIRDKFKLEVDSFLSGPMGGDQQIGAAIAQNEIDLLFFFWDPLEAQPHDPDVKALLRIAVLYDVPVAQSVTGALFLIHSPLFNEAYSKEIMNPQENLNKRLRELAPKL